MERSAVFEIAAHSSIENERLNEMREVKLNRNLIKTLAFQFF